MRQFMILGGFLALLAPAPAYGQAGQKPAQPPGFVRQFGSDVFRDSHCFDVDISPDGKVVAIAGARLRLWDLAGRKLISEVPAPDIYAPHKVRFSPDGKHLGCLYWDNQVCVLDRATGKLVLTLPTNEWRYAALAFAHDGKLLATVNDKGNFQLWEVPGGKMLANSDRHLQLAQEAKPNEKQPYADLTTLLFTPDGKYLVTACSDGPIVLWKTNPLKEVRRFEPMTRRACSMVCTPDGKRLIASGEVKSDRGDWWGVVALDVETGTVLNSFRGPMGRTDSLSVAADGKRVAFISDRLRVFDLLAEKVTFETVDETGGGLVRFTPDGEHLFAITSGIRLWDLKAGKELQAQDGHTCGIYSVAFAPDEKTIASGGGDGTIRLWETATGKQVRILRGHQAQVTAVAFAPDGTKLASTGGDRTLRLWDVKTGNLLHMMYNPAIEKFEFYQAAFSADGKTVVASSHNFELLFFDVATGKLLKQLRGYDGWSYGTFTPFTWSADRKIIAACGGIGNGSKLLEPITPGKAGQKDGPLPGFHIYLWDVATGQVRQKIGYFVAPVYVAMTPDGKTVAASDFRQITFWDTATGKQTGTLANPKGFPQYAPDGRTFAAGRQLFVNGIGQPPVELPYASVHPLAFSPDGDRVIFGADGHATIMLWDLQKLRK
jgi:WD40 repeat protein